MTDQPTTTAPADNYEAYAAAMGLTAPVSNIEADMPSEGLTLLQAGRLHPGASPKNLNPNNELDAYLQAMRLPTTHHHR